MAVKAFQRASWFKGIEAKLSGILVCLISLVFIGFMIFNYLTVRSTLHQELQNTGERVSARLGKNLLNPLWNLDKDQALEVIRSEIVEKSVFAILVREPDGKKILSGLIRNDKWDVINTDKEITGEFLTKKKDIKKDEGKIGSVEIYFSKKFLDQQLWDAFVNLLITVVLINLVLVISLFFSMKSLLIRPLNKVINGLNVGADQVSLSSGQISSSSQSLAEGTTEQAASLEETSASLEEMSSMIRQNADNANQADNLMKDTNRIVANANESMSHLTRSMREISVASEETSKIIKTIDEIAFQTNLLALNAAVEAARAGEAGAGFAVVADEVRNLAMRAAEAAKNTSKLIEGTVKKVNEGSELVKSANGVFNEVAQSAEKVGTLVSEIAMASKEQSQGIEQINKAISQLDKVVQHNAAAAEESSAAAEEMYTQADQMKNYVQDLVSLIGGKTADLSAGSSQEPVLKKKTSGRLPAPERRFGGQVKGHTAGKKEISPKDIIKFDEDEFKEF